MKESKAKAAATASGSQETPETTTFLPPSHPSSLTSLAALGNDAITTTGLTSVQTAQTTVQPLYLLQPVLPARTQTSSNTAGAALLQNITGQPSTPAGAGTTPAAMAATPAVTTTCDPTKITTWGPKRYTYPPRGGNTTAETDKTNDRDRKKDTKGKRGKEGKTTTKNGYLINPPSDRDNDDNDGDDGDDDGEEEAGLSSPEAASLASDSEPADARLSAIRSRARRAAPVVGERGSKASTVTVSGSEESTTSETTEELPGGRVRKTWVTLVRMVTVEEEEWADGGEGPSSEL